MSDQRMPSHKLELIRAKRKADKARDGNGDGNQNYNGQNPGPSGNGENSLPKLERIYSQNYTKLSEVMKHNQSLEVMRRFTRLKNCKTTESGVDNKKRISNELKILRKNQAEYDESYLDTLLQEEVCKHMRSFGDRLKAQGEFATMISQNEYYVARRAYMKADEFRKQCEEFNQGLEAKNAKLQQEVNVLREQMALINEVDETNRTVASENARLKLQLAEMRKNPPGTSAVDTQVLISPMKREPEAVPISDSPNFVEPKVETESLCINNDTTPFGTAIKEEPEDEDSSFNEQHLEDPTVALSTDSLCINDDGMPLLTYIKPEPVEPQEEEEDSGLYGTDMDFYGIQFNDEQMDYSTESQCINVIEIGTSTTEDLVISEPAQIDSTQAYAYGNEMFGERMDFEENPAIYENNGMPDTTLSRFSPVLSDKGDPIMNSRYYDTDNFTSNVDNFGEPSSGSQLEAHHTAVTPCSIIYQDLDVSQLPEIPDDEDEFDECKFRYSDIDEEFRPKFSCERGESESDSDSKSNESETPIKLKTVNPKKISGFYTSGSSSSQNEDDPQLSVRARLATNVSEKIPVNSGHMCQKLQLEATGSKKISKDIAIKLNENKRESMSDTSSSSEFGQKSGIRSGARTKPAAPRKRTKSQLPTAVITGILELDLKSESDTSSSECSSKVNESSKSDAPAPLPGTGLPSESGSGIRLSSESGSGTGPLSSESGSGIRLPSELGSGIRLSSESGSGTGPLSSESGSGIRLPSELGSGIRLPSELGPGIRLPYESGSGIRLSSESESGTGPLSSESESGTGPLSSESESGTGSSSVSGPGSGSSSELTDGEIQSDSDATMETPRSPEAEVPSSPPSANIHISGTGTVDPSMVNLAEGFTAGMMRRLMNGIQLIENIDMIKEQSSGITPLAQAICFYNMCEKIVSSGTDNFKAVMEPHITLVQFLHTNIGAFYGLINVIVDYFIENVVSNRDHKYKSDQFFEPLGQIMGDLIRISPAFQLIDLGRKLIFETLFWRPPHAFAFVHGIFRRSANVYCSLPFAKHELKDRACLFALLRPPLYYRAYYYQELKTLMASVFVVEPDLTFPQFIQQVQKEILEIEVSTKIEEAGRILAMLYLNGQIQDVISIIKGHFSVCSNSNNSSAFDSLVTTIGTFLDVKMGALGKDFLLDLRDFMVNMAGEKVSGKKAFREMLGKLTNKLEHTHGDEHMLEYRIRYNQNQSTQPKEKRPFRKNKGRHTSMYRKGGANRNSTQGKVLPGSSYGYGPTRPTNEELDKDAQSYQAHFENSRVKRLQRDPNSSTAGAGDVYGQKTRFKKPNSQSRKAL